MLSAWRLFIAILILWKNFEYFYIFAGSHAESELESPTLILMEKKQL